MEVHLHRRGGMSETEVVYQSRYVAYARAHDMAPEAMDAHDNERFPGGCMAGYITWINDRWREWEALTGRRQPYTDADHDSFDAWLATR